jgi:hypothetical protein
MLQQAAYLQQTMLAAFQNLLAAELDAGAGYLIRHPRIEIPKPPPFIGGSLTLNNISVSGSTIGAINTGTIQTIDASITVLRSGGESDLAAAVKRLTEAIIASNEINDSLKNEIAEQLAFLSAEAATKPENRSVGIIKSVLAGIRDSISVAAGLITIWDKVEPVFKTAFGI